MPSSLRYTRSHEWVRMEDQTATIGITDHAQRELTDVVFVELPPVGRTLKAGESCAVVESVKTASDIYTPLSGEVVECNAALASSPGLVNSDPYGQGWFFKLRPSNARELEDLLSSEAYGQSIGS